eukprot:357435-Chlamydomonas_euryale.AAC.5
MLCPGRWASCVCATTAAATSIKASPTEMLYSFWQGPNCLEAGTVCMQSEDKPILSNKLRSNSKFVTGTDRMVSANGERLEQYMRANLRIGVRW